MASRRRSILLRVIELAAQEKISTLPRKNVLKVRLVGAPKVLIEFLQKREVILVNSRSDVSYVLETRGFELAVMMICSVQLHVWKNGRWRRIQSTPLIVNCYVLGINISILNDLNVRVSRVSVLPMDGNLEFCLFSIFSR